MGANDWANAYRVGRTNVDFPHGATRRPFPGGQKIGNLPVSNAPFSAQTAAKVITLADYDSGLVTSPSQATLVVEVASPSRRLACGLQLFYEFGSSISALPVNGSAPLQSSLYEMGVNPLSGARSPMRIIGTNFGACSYEVDPVYRAVRLVVNVSTFNLDYTQMGISRAWLRLAVNWEPNIDMSAAELSRLYSLTEITIPTMVSC